MCDVQYYLAASLHPETMTMKTSNVCCCFAIFQGYEGVLCGSCADGYGHFANGECQKCKNKGFAIFGMFLVFIIALMSVLMEIFLAIWGHQSMPSQEPEAAGRQNNGIDGASTSQHTNHHDASPRDIQPPSVQQKNEAVEKAMEVFKVSLHLAAKQLEVPPLH